jgi:hypothetical protein
MKSTILSLVPLAGGAIAHGGIYTYVLNGKTYNG